MSELDEQTIETRLQECEKLHEVMSDGKPHMLDELAKIMPATCAWAEAACVSEQLPRDTQFAGFAKLLAEESGKMPISPKEPIEETNRRYQLLIARRAYDLVQHAVGHSLEYLHECGIEFSISVDKRIQPTIPDITDWKQWGLPDE